MEKLSSLLSEQKRKTESLIRKIVVELLKKAPDNTISLVNNPAYALIESIEHRVELGVFGLRRDTLPSKEREHP